MLADNNGFGGNTPFTFTGFVPGRNLLFLPLLHLPFIFPASKQALLLPALICRDAGVSIFPPSPPLPRWLCPLSAPATPSWLQQGGELGQAGPTLGPTLLLAQCWAPPAPSKDRESHHDLLCWLQDPPITRGNGRKTSPCSLQGLILVRC